MKMCLVLLRAELFFLMNKICWFFSDNNCVIMAVREKRDVFFPIHVLDTKCVLATE